MKGTLQRCLLALPLLVACQAGPSLELPTPDPPAETEAGRRSQDLDYMLRVLERRHPNLFAHVTRAAVDVEVEALRARLPNLDRVGFILGLGRVLALFGDSHTRLAGTPELDQDRLPLSFRSYADELYVAGATEPLRDLFGGEVLSMGGLNFAQLQARAAALIPHENDVLLRHATAQWLSRRCALVELGILERGRALDLRVRGRDGQERAASIEAEDRGRPAWWAAPDYEPIVLERHKDEPYWAELPPDGRTLYVRYAQCRDWPERPFADFAAAVLARLDRGEADRLVLDLRRNGGGNSAVLRPLLTGLARRFGPDSEDGVVVLIGPGTYSSATLNAIQLRREVGATLVGEASAQRPNCFGEVRGFPLPNTGIRIDSSTRAFRMIPTGDPPTLEPDIVIPTSFEDEYLGRDPVLDWALAQDGPSG
jgi:hypothetical protein